MGRSIINWGGVMDSQLDGNSEHPLTNKAATAEFLRIQNLITEKIEQVTSLITNVGNMRATTVSPGMVQFATDSDITDVNAYALSAIEKNPNAPGSIMNSIDNLYNLINLFITPTLRCPLYQSKDLNDIGHTSVYNGNYCANEPANIMVDQWYFVITLVHNWSINYRTQIVINMHNISGKSIAVRSRDSGGWNPWFYSAAFTENLN